METMFELYLNAQVAKHQLHDYWAYTQADSRE